jgi:hypothetical protein
MSAGFSTRSRWAWQRSSHTSSCTSPSSPTDTHRRSLTAAGVRTGCPLCEQNGSGRVSLIRSLTGTQVPAPARPPLGRRADQGSAPVPAETIVQRCADDTTMPKLRRVYRAAPRAHGTLIMPNGTVWPSAPGAFEQVRRTVRAVRRLGLIIRGSWVRAPPAPQEADDALREMPDEFELKQLQEFGDRHGILGRTCARLCTGGTPKGGGPGIARTIGTAR